MISKIENKIKKANIAYRNGDEIMTDTQYDDLLEELRSLDPYNDLLNVVGIETVDDSRKETLPIPMKSMNKVKTIDEIYEWFKSKNIPSNTPIVITPKFDGVSLIVQEQSKKAYTRGNGVVGQRSDKHLDKMNVNNINEDIITFGEAIMKKQIFLDKYSKELSNPRNTVSGKLNEKKVSKILEDINYIRYGLVGKNFNTKVGQLEYLNSLQSTKVDFKTFTINQLSEDSLMNLFKEWGKIFEIDGLILEVDNRKLWNELGKETSSGNPVGSRAYKSETFTTGVISEVVDITWEISKNGLLKPIGNIHPVKIEGVIVRNVTLYNARFVKENDINIGTKLEIIRSGFVIPKVIRVINPTGFELPQLDVDIGWNENGVELVTLEVTDTQRLKQIISFFEILEVDNLGEGNIKAFFENGYDSVKKILQMSKNDMNQIERFGERKSNIIYDNIHSSMSSVQLSKLQHGSGFFDNLGSKKLLLLEGLDETTSINEICNIEGFSEISAINYLDGILKYKEFEKDLGSLVTVKKTEVKESSSNELEGMSFIFSGFRDKKSEEQIISMGGEIKSSISKNVTHLVLKDKNSTSSKAVKAKTLGINIFDKTDLIDLIYKSKSLNEKVNQE